MRKPGPSAQVWTVEKSGALKARNGDNLFRAFSAFVVMAILTWGVAPGYCIFTPSALKQN
jgi:hypothetical protein